MEEIEATPEGPKSGDTYTIPDSIAKAANLYREKAESARYGMAIMAEQAKDSHKEMWAILSEHLPKDLMKDWKLGYDTEKKEVTLLRKLKTWEKSEKED